MVRVQGRCDEVHAVGLQLLVCDLALRVVPTVVHVTPTLTLIFND
jgi:hypothetical protein